MGANIEWSKEQTHIAIGIFKRVYPDWDISEQIRCPKCQANYPSRRIGQNFCYYHQFTYMPWLLNQRGAMIQQMAFREQKLKQELVKAKLWF